MTELRCFSRRRVSPLRTTVQVVEADAARAVSYDGVNWQLAALAGQQTAWGSLNAGRGALGFVTFAVWSREEGIAYLPRSPLLSKAELDEAVAPLLAFLSRAETPFPADDPLEYWLLDDLGEPLALLATACGLWGAREVRAGPWQAQVEGEPPDAAAARVEALVRSAATGRQRQWFRRASEGEGQPMPDLGPLVHSEPIPAERFPALPLREAWPDTVDAELIRAYLDARACLLLTLPALSASARSRLEPAAWRQALEADRLHRIFPEVIDHAGYQAMRVEAALRRCA